MSEKTGAKKGTKKTIKKAAKKTSSTRKPKNPYGRFKLDNFDLQVSNLYSNIFSLYIPAGELYSSNTQLAPGRTRGGKPYLYLSDRAKKYKAWIKHVLDELYFNSKSDISKQLKAANSIVVNFYFISKDIQDKDTTNMVKTVEDAISEWLGVDDSLWDTVSLTRLRSNSNVSGIVVYFVLDF